LSRRYLSLKEREEIAILKAKGWGVRQIGRQLNRSPSTISRELRRNAATRTDSSGYRAVTAQWHADRRARRPKVAKLPQNDALRDYVQDRLAGKIAKPSGELVAGPEVPWIGRRHGRRADRRWARAWSPEQIANRLVVDFPHDESMRLSHEAIYQALYVQCECLKQATVALEVDHESPGLCRISSSIAMTTASSLACCSQYRPPAPATGSMQSV